MLVNLRMFRCISLKYKIFFNIKYRNTRYAIELLIVKLVIWKIKVLLIVGKPISSVPLKYLVIEINVYNIASMISIMT